MRPTSSLDEMLPSGPRSKAVVAPAEPARNRGRRKDPVADLPPPAELAAGPVPAPPAPVRVVVPPPPAVVEVPAAAVAPIVEAPVKRKSFRRAPKPAVVAAPVLAAEAAPIVEAPVKRKSFRRAPKPVAPPETLHSEPALPPPPRAPEVSASGLLDAQPVPEARVIAPPPPRALGAPADVPRAPASPLTPLAAALGAGATRNPPAADEPGAAARNALAARAAAPPPPAPAMGTETVVDAELLTEAPDAPAPEPAGLTRRERRTKPRSRSRSRIKRGAAEATTAAAASTTATSAGAESTADNNADAGGDEIHDQIRREARSAGLGNVEMPSTEAVARRRFQLWGVAAVVLGMIVVALVVAGVSKSSGDDWVSPRTLRFAVIGLALGFTLYAVEKEVHLRRLGRLLVDERVLNAALTNRLKMHSALTAAGKAVNSVLDLDQVLEVILSSALDMLEGSEGSVMLVESDAALAVVAVQGTQLVKGQRVSGDATLAGHVARTREPHMVAAGAGGAGGAADPRAADDRSQGAMCVPLVNRGELLGVLDVEARRDRAFDEYDLHVLSLFAEPAAAAIANARLYGAERAHVAELLDLDRMKSQFVATVSHELRTPLTSIRGAIAAARRPVTDGQRSELFDVVERQTDRLATMVEEMFAAAQLERHGSAPLLRRIELASLVRLVALDSQVAGRPVKVDAPETCEVRADPEAMRRIVTNLVENAHKYGAAPIRLIVEPDGDRVMLSVVDNGPGVPAAEREKIFERFYRAEHTRDNRPGIGLGLPIVRGLAEACGGSVWVEDAPGGGAAFRVSLRTRHADEQEAPWPASPRS